MESVLIESLVTKVLKDAIILKHGSLSLETFLKFQKIETYGFAKFGDETMLRIFQDVKLVGIGSEIPIKIGYISGSFDVSFNKLTTTKNFPKTICGNIRLNSNLLKDMCGFNTIFSGTMFLDNNKSLKSLKGINQHINGSISAYDCNIESIDFGRSTDIIGDLILSKNCVRSLKISNTLSVGGSLILCDNLISSHDEKTNSLLEYGYIDLSNNPISSDSWEANCRGW